MDKFIYVSMNGASNDLAAQTRRMNNLANVTTTGFRASLDAAVTKGEDGNSLALTPGASVERQDYYDFKPGSVNTTARPLDVAIKEHGWFAVQGPDGKEHYTRAGNFQLTENGLLTTSNGLPVIGGGGPISIPPAEKINIGSDGTISIVPAGADSTTLAVVGQLKLVNPPNDTLARSESGLFYRKDGQDSDPDLNVGVISGALEGSNVNVMSELVGVMDSSRSFELHVKLMKEAKDQADYLARIMQLS